VTETKSAIIMLLNMTPLYPLVRIKSIEVRGPSGYRLRPMSRNKLRNRLMKSR